MAEKKQPPIEKLHTSWFPNVPRLEARSLAGPDGRTSRIIGGVASLFGAPSNPRLGFLEIVERSCFNKSEGDGYPLVRALFEHQPGIVLGAVHSGTLRISQDVRAMNYEVDMPETRSAEYESIQRGDVHASSVAFQVYQDEWRRGSNGLPERHLVSARLDHIAPTSMPAYPDATVSLRSLAEVKEADLDEVVRDALNGNLNRYFIRTDNIDQRNPDMEQRSAPLVTINMGREGIEVHEGKPEETPEPVEAEQKTEDQPDPKPESPGVKDEKVETPPPVETAVVEQKTEAKPEPPVETKPEPPKEPELPAGFTELMALRNQNRGKRFPKPPDEDGK